MKVLSIQWAVVVMALSTSVDAQTLQPDSPRVDLHGDPLPPGAIARMGSVRWRATAGVNRIAFLPDGKSLLTVGSENMLTVWDAGTGLELERIGPANRPDTVERDALDLALSRDGRLAAVARGGSIGDEVGAEVFDLRTGELVAEFSPFAAPPPGALTWGVQAQVLSVVFTLDGKHLVTGDERGAVRLWEIESGREVLTREWPAFQGGPVYQADGSFWTADPAKVLDLALSPDGRTLAAMARGGGTSTTLALWPLGSDDLPRMIRTEARGPISVEFSHEGHRIILGNDFTQRMRSSAPGVLDMTEYRGGMEIWDVESGARSMELRPLDGRSGVSGFALHPDGVTLAVNYWDEPFRLWSVETGRLLSERRLRLSHLGEGERIALSPDGWRLAAARMNGIAVFDLERDAPPILENRDTHAGLASGAIVALAYTPDGERLISAGREGTIRVWDAATGAPLRVLGAKEKQNYYHFMAASRDGKVAALEWSNISEVYSVDDGRLLARLESPRSSNRKSALSADGRFFAVGNTGPIDQEEARRAVVSGTESAPLFIEVWDVSSRERLRTFRGSELRLRNLWFSPDGKLLIGVDRDGGVRLWERETGVLRFRFDTGERVGRDYALAPDGRHLVSLGPVSQRARFQANPRPISEDVPVSDNEIVFWDLETGEATRRVTLPYEAARSLALTPDGRRAVTFSMSMTHYSIWDLETGAELQRIEPPRGLGMNALAMAPDGRSFAIGLNDGTILVYPMPPE